MSNITLVIFGLCWGAICFPASTKGKGQNNQSNKPNFTSYILFQFCTYVVTNLIQELRIKYSVPAILKLETEVRMTNGTGW